MIDGCAVELDSAPLRVVYVCGVAVFSQLVFTCFTLFSSFVENASLIVLFRIWVVYIEYHFWGKLTNYRYLWNRSRHWKHLVTTAIEL